jgi:hypothetical protein
MHLDGRISTGEYHRFAARWRRLAADATTALTRNHLLKLARHCEFLAGDNAGRVRKEREEPGLLDAPS